MASAPAAEDAPAPASPEEPTAAVESAPAAPDSEESAPADPELPAVFSKRVPESVDDLRELQDHLRTLVEKLSACTVSIQIGPAQGSGVIVTNNGYILTAAHVSGKPGRRVDAIVLHDGRTVTGMTLGRDDTLDAGLIKIDQGADWPHADMAPAQSIEFGEWCVAAGHPGGYHDGRPPVMRLGRVLFATKRVIQSDCELVGGDSGGPLFDMQGRVIGINSRIGEETQLNFHVPIVAYSQSWERLTTSESFNSHSGALLGISGKPHAAGLEVTTVHPGDPADDAKIKVGDILVTFGARKVATLAQLIELVGTYQPRREVKLELLRDGKLVEVKVRLGFRFD
ncbi:MAG: trypsin-like peptidase domain-containing protein [Planctomycetaceae bacterium]|nr:trypsin-like peptidase domain-containing protein [Planctomycetaceae bacterium]